MSGVTSSSTRSFTSPERTPACTAAPTATTSSGLTPLCGSLPKNFLTVSYTSGMRVEPPTRTISSISFGLFFASFSAVLHRLHRALDERRNHLLELRARQPHVEVHRAARHPTVMNGRLIPVSCTLESSIFAFSAASFRRCSAILSLRRSIRWPS